MYYIIAPTRALLFLSGRDVFSFLQGLVTNNVNALHHESMIFSALLSPQGKFLHDFFLVSWKDGIVLDVEKYRLPDLLQRLKMYRLRSDVIMEPLPETYAVALIWGQDAEQLTPPDAVECIVVHDPRARALGFRAVGDAGVLDAWCRAQGMQLSDFTAYERHRLENAVPSGSVDMQPDKSFVLPFGYDDLHAIDFTKGCYVGQEVTARSKHLGQLKKRLYSVRSLQGTIPVLGTPVYRGDVLAGEMRSSVDSVGLALLSVEEVEASQTAVSTLQAGGHMLSVSIPSWMKK